MNIQRTFEHNGLFSMVDFGAGHLRRAQPELGPKQWSILLLNMQQMQHGIHINSCQKVLRNSLALDSHAWQILLSHHLLHCPQVKISVAQRTNMESSYMILPNRLNHYQIIQPFKWEQVISYQHQFTHVKEREETVAFCLTSDLCRPLQGEIFCKF